MKKIVFFMLFCFGLFLNFNALGYYEQNDNKCIESCAALEPSKSVKDGSCVESCLYDEDKPASWIK